MNPIQQVEALNAKISETVSPIVREYMDSNDSVDPIKMCVYLSEKTFPLIQEYTPLFEEIYSPYIKGKRFSLGDALTVIMTIAANEPEWEDISDEERSDWADASMEIARLSTTSEANYRNILLATMGYLDAMVNDEVTEH